MTHRRAEPIPAVFTPEAVSIINRAYARALDLLAANGSGDRLKVTLAEQMMNLARCGELDEERLYSLALARTTDRSPSDATSPGA